MAAAPTPAPLLCTQVVSKSLRSCEGRGSVSQGDTGPQSFALARLCMTKKIPPRRLMPPTNWSKLNCPAVPVPSARPPPSCAGNSPGAVGRLRRICGDCFTTRRRSNLADCQRMWRRHASRQMTEDRGRLKFRVECIRRKEAPQHRAFHAADVKSGVGPVTGEGEVADARSIRL
jgi:hypothetical protein